jgi:hypothetical protein
VESGLPYLFAGIHAISDRRISSWPRTRNSSRDPSSFGFIRPARTFISFQVNTLEGIHESEEVLQIDVLHVLQIFLRPSVASRHKFKPTVAVEARHKGLHTSNQLDRKTYETMTRADFLTFFARCIRVPLGVPDREMLAVPGGGGTSNGPGDDRGVWISSSSISVSSLGRFLLVPLRRLISPDGNVSTGEDNVAWKLVTL